MQCSALKYELPGSAGTFIDLLNDSDIQNMWEAWQEHVMTGKLTYKLKLFVEQVSMAGRHGLE